MIDNDLRIASPIIYSGPFGWGFRIYRLHCCREVRPPDEYPGYGTIKSDGETSVMQELWKIWEYPSLQLLPGPLWLGVVAPERVLIRGQTELRGI